MWQNVQFATDLLDTAFSWPQIQDSRIWIEIYVIIISSRLHWEGKHLPLFHQSIKVLAVKECCNLHFPLSNHNNYDNTVEYYRIKRTSGCQYKTSGFHRYMVTNLGEKVAPEKWRLDQANSCRIPIVLCRHRKNGNAHIYLPNRTWYFKLLS